MRATVSRARREALTTSAKSIDRRIEANMSQTWYFFNLTVEGLETYLKIKGVAEMPRSFLERFVAALWLTVLS